MKNSRGVEWQRARDIEDMLALLADIDDERKIIRARAFDLGHLEIYQASEVQRASIARLRAALSANWSAIQEIINTDAD